MEYALDQLVAGDVLQITGDLDHYIVEKIWLTEQGSYRWVDYETRGRRSQQRLVVSAEYDDGEWETVLYDAFPASHELPQAEQLPDSLTWQGQTYRRQERGSARIRLVGDESAELDYRYADYSAEGGNVLAVEIFGAGAGPDSTIEVELYAGREVPSEQVQIFAPINTEERLGLIRTRAVGKTREAGGVTFSPQQLMIGGIALLALIAILVTVLG